MDERRSRSFLAKQGISYHSLEWIGIAAFGGVCSLVKFSCQPHLLNYPFCPLFQFFHYHFGSYSYQYFIVHVYTNHILIKFLTCGIKIKRQKENSSSQLREPWSGKIHLSLEEVPYKHPKQFILVL